MSSKFTKIFTARNASPAEGPAADTIDEQTDTSPAPPPRVATPSMPQPPADEPDAPPQTRERKKRSSEASENNAPPPPASNGKKPGRPPGKRSDPAYGQVTAYIRKDTYSAVQVALIQAGKGQEFSELVEELLAKWLKPRT